MEKGESCVSLVSASNFQHPSTPRGYLWKLVAAVVAVLSVVALATAIAALTLQLEEDKTQEVSWNKQLASIPRNLKKSELEEVIVHSTLLIIHVFCRFIHTIIVYFRGILFSW